MENNKETKKPTAAQLRKKEEQVREKISFNLDNYSIATDLCLAMLQVENTSGEVKDRANEVLLSVLDKMHNL